MAMSEARKRSGKPAIDWGLAVMDEALKHYEPWERQYGEDATDRERFAAGVAAGIDAALKQVKREFSPRA